MLVLIQVLQVRRLNKLNKTNLYIHHTCVSCVIIVSFIHHSSAAYMYSTVHTYGYTCQCAQYTCDMYKFLLQFTVPVAPLNLRGKTVVTLCSISILPCCTRYFWRILRRRGRRWEKVVLFEFTTHYLLLVPVSRVL